MNITQVLIKPVLTEKGTGMANRKIYAFQVNINASKNQVKSAVEKLYGVTVGEVRTITRKGKMRKTGKKMVKTNLSDKKLAYVVVSKGKIDLFPQA